MKKILNKILSNKFSKISLGLIGLNLILGIYDIVKVYSYFDTLIIAIIALVLLVILMGLLLMSSRYPKSSIVMNIILSIILIVSTLGLNKTSEFTETITDTTEYEYVDIVVMKDSELDIDSDLSGKVMGAYLDDELGLKRARSILEENNKVNVNERLFDDIMDAYKALKENDIDMLVITDEVISYLEEEVNYEEETRSLFTKAYEIDTDYVTKDVDVLNESFTVYLCGTDASGKKNVSSSSRADANMLLTVNPKTKQISLQIIPRDLYSYVEHKNGSTKLSWSGRYGGITTSMKALEHELGININYYAKINWQGLKDLVDALGGIDVYSHYTYQVGKLDVKKGMNHLATGEEAFFMCGWRKSLPNNEISRGLQQMEVLKGIINKVAQTKSLDNILALLDAIENNFITDFPEEKFVDAFSLMVSMRAQLGDIDSYTLKGEYFWKYDDFKKNYYAYYLRPNKGEVEKVRDRINDVLLGR